nr:hypothetical protein [Wolbachia endosymbiont of Culex quinquefasciatus]
MVGTPDGLNRPEGVIKSPFSSPVQKRTSSAVRLPSSLSSFSEVISSGGVLSVYSIVTALFAVIELFSVRFITPLLLSTI